jgi:hypothetical protein
MAQVVRAAELETLMLLGSRSWPLLSVADGPQMARRSFRRAVGLASCPAVALAASRVSRRPGVGTCGRLPVTDRDYPEQLLAREPAPPFEGEGPFALWHFSEDPSLERFRPHVPATNPRAQPLVWAVDTRHAPMFWFPRDCPRGCIWPVSGYHG